MSKKEVKTNAMRMLERQKIPYTYETYKCDEFTDGTQVADKLGYEHNYVYKTLVTTGKSGEHYVFVIPIDEEIDFKKAAKEVGEMCIRDRLGIGRNRAYQFIQEIYQSENPPFKVIKIGSLYRIPKASFDHWLKDPS